MSNGSRLGLIMVIVLAAFEAVATTASGEPVRVVPLGGTTGNQTGDAYYGVYVPTRHGGILTIKSSSGQVDEVKGPSGQAHANSVELGKNQHGWHTFRVSGTSNNPYTVATTFVQEARAERIPWNYYYWPTKGDVINEPWSGGNGKVDSYQVRGDDIMVVASGAKIEPGQDIIRPGRNGKIDSVVSQGDESTWFPNLYDDLFFRSQDGSFYQTPAPLLKYDQLFGAYSRAWESANTQNQDIQRWPGHCLGVAVASIMLEEPKPAPGSGLTQDELKGLWAELGENHYNHKIGENATEIPAGPPRPGPDPCDLSVGRFHSMIEDFIQGRHKAVLANLRAFPPRGGAAEVWNHGVGKYDATYEAVSNTELRYRVKMKLYGSAGSNLGGSENKPRLNTYEYIVTYGTDGSPNEKANWSNDWIAVGGEAMYAPLNVLEITASKWKGHNPFVTEDKVRMLDLANGGANERFAKSTAPQFKPVADYESGQAVLAAIATPSPTQPVRGVGAPNSNPNMNGVGPEVNSGLTGLFGADRSSNPGAMPNTNGATTSNGWVVQPNGTMVYVGAGRPTNAPTPGLVAGTPPGSYPYQVSPNAGATMGGGGPAFNPYGPVNPAVPNNGVGMTPAPTARPGLFGGILGGSRR